MVQAYCLKEKKHVEVKNPDYKLNARGTPVVAGTCSSCGGKVTKILKKEEIPAPLAAEAAKYKAGKNSGKKSGGKPSGKKSGKKPSGKKSGKKHSKK